MRLVSFEQGFGRVEGDQVIPMGTNLQDYLNTGESADGTPMALADVVVGAPLAKPGKIICVGLNYRSHAEEVGADIPEKPILFAKFANSVIGPDDTIVVPRATRQPDYEAELCVVIGKTTKDVGVGEALEHVAGYMNANDVSARDLQFETGQWTVGKAVDTFLPTGPYLVTADEITDPQNLSVRLRIGDETLQDGHTSDMIFTIAELIAFISRTITLEPGDLIVTGTPSGVGDERDPKRWLLDGETVHVEIAGLGVLSNPVKWENA